MATPSSTCTPWDHSIIGDSRTDAKELAGVRQTQLCRLLAIPGPLPLAANVSPATIYVCFESKEDLLNQIYLMVERETSEALLAGYDDRLSVEEGFRLIWENGFRYMLTNPTRFAFSEQFMNSPLVNRVSEEAGSEYFRAIVSLFERGKQEGIFKDIPQSLFVAFFYAPPLMLGKQHQNGEVSLDRELRQKALEFTGDAFTI
jgi:AcrR family transcriptional regulator